MKKREYRGNKKKKSSGHESEAASEFLIRKSDLEIKTQNTPKKP